MVACRNRCMNNKGVTLVEVMISLVILLFVFMGLIQASLVSINSNLRNEIRDAAVGVASEYMARAKATSIDTVATVVCPLPPLPACPNAVYTQAAVLNVPVLRRQIRSATQDYAVATCGCFTDALQSNATIIVTVTYTAPGDAVPNTQTITSVVKRP